jgi:lipoprotein-anchoring transpeptidase ErfK/SrfK
MIRLSTLLAAILVFGSNMSAWTTTAQAGWENGQPVFASQIRQREKEREARRRAARSRAYSAFSSGGAQPKITPKAPPVITLVRQETPGTVIVDTHGRRLFYVLSEGKAYEYPISVGRQGFTWKGTEKVSRQQSWPSWTPPPEMRRRQSWLPITMSGGLRNPLGAKAIYLGESLYRIHGTNNPKSIGRAASSGCFRMMNHHVLHLSGLVKIGTQVRVVKRYRPDEVADLEY